MDLAVTHQKPQPNKSEPATVQQQEPARDDSFMVRVRRIGRVICEVAFADRYPLTLF